MTNPVVRDPDMTVAEKRSVLASWASDACAIESNPALRETASGSIANYDDIIDALQSLDGGSSETATYAYKPATAKAVDQLERSRPV